VALKKPENDLEVIVIDNGSNDNTKSVIESFNRRVRNLRYIYEERPGLHVGRHLGAKEAKGEVLCYLDDDSFVDKNWLVGIDEAFKNSEIDLSGGPNLPEFEEKPPKWINYFWEKTPFGKYLAQLSLLDFGNKPKWVPACYVFGCNYIIRRKELFELGGFNPDSVPQDLLKYRGDGETGLSAKLNSHGKKAYYSPKIKVKHFVPKDRMKEEYFCKRAFNQGISDSFTDLRIKQSIHSRDDFDFIRNFKIERQTFFKKKLNKAKAKFEKYRLKNRTKNCSSFNDYRKIQELMRESYKNGFAFHKMEVEQDLELKKYVLKESYLND
jgi:glycosyltransferase involved in cell wall biosynthesis